MLDGRGDRIALIIFLLSFACIVFVAGTAVGGLRLPPYGLILKAKNAAEALLALEDDSLMPTLLALDPEAPAAPIASTLDPAAGSEPLLVTGGFYQDMEECPRFGCLATVIDRAGVVLHKWEVDPGAVAAAAPERFAGQFGPDNIYPIGLAYVPGGDLIVTFHARNSFPYQVGLARIGRHGEVRWVEVDHTHHWLDATPDGTSYAPSARVIPTPANVPGTGIVPRCHNDQTFEEGVRVRSGDGGLVRDYWLGEALVEAGLPGLLYAVRDWCDPFHVNSVELVSEDVAAKLEGVSAGDLLISARESNTVAIVDADDGRILLHSTGRTVAQHSPRFLPDGSVVVFDNQGAARGEDVGSRIVRLDLESNEAVTVYPREGVSSLPLRSDDGGHLSVSPDGRRVMVSSKNQSMSFEFDLASGRPLWSLMIGYDISPYLEASGRAAEETRAWFTSYGVYYLDPQEVEALAK